MKRSEFLEKFISLMEKQDVICWIESNVTYELILDDSGINDIEIEDSFTCCSIDYHRKLKYLFIKFGRKTITLHYTYLSYDTDIQSAIHVSLLEMGFVHVYIKSMINIIKNHKSDKNQDIVFDLSDLIDDIVCYELENACITALNTDFISICKERKYIFNTLCKLPVYRFPNERDRRRRGYDIDLIRIYKEYGTFFDIHFNVDNLIKRFPDKSKCIPILLRYTHDQCKTKNNEEIRL